MSESGVFLCKPELRHLEYRDDVVVFRQLAKNMFLMKQE